MRYTILVITVILTVSGFYAYWSWLADQIQVSVNTFIAEQEAKGVSISYGSLKTHGFPYRVQTTVKDIQAEGTTVEGNVFSLQVTQIDGWIMPWSFNHIVTQLEGPQTLTLDRGGRPPLTLTLSQSDARSSVVLEDEEVSRIAVDMNDITIQSSEQSDPASIARLQIHTRKPDATTQDLFLKGENINLGRDDIGMGRLMPLFQIHLSLPEPHPVALNKDDIDQWRQAGGIINLPRFDMHWEGVTTQTNGTLALDDALRPIGSLTTRVNGHERIIDYFKGQGQISDNGASLAKASLGLLKAAAGELSVPLNLQDGKATLGPVELGKVKPLFP